MKTRIAILAVALHACGSQPKSAGPVEEPAVTQPLRTVTERPLFGGMPLDNLMLDPGFALLDGVGWMALGGSGWSWPSMVRVHLPQTPTGQPALLASATEVRSGYVVLGAARSKAQPLQVELWLGRRSAATDLEAAEVNVSLAGVFLDGATEAVDLAPDASTDPLLIDDVVWHRFAATLAEGPVGWANLAVVDDANDDLLLHAPTLIVDRDKARRSAAARRALRPVERRAMEAVRESFRDRFQRPRTNLLAPFSPPHQPNRREYSPEPHR